MVDKNWIKHQEEGYTPKGIEPGIATKSLNSTRVKLALSCIGRGEKVLDLGCNDGAITNEIFKKGNDVVGVDLKGIVNIARKKFPRIKFVAHDLSQRFPWRNGSFDTAVALEIIEHVVDDELFLQECFRILKKDGRLILSVPNVAYFPFRIALMLGKFYEFGTHVHNYTFETIRKKLENVGFKIMAEKGAEYESGPRKWYFIEKILPKTYKATIIVCARKP